MDQVRVVPPADGQSTAAPATDDTFTWILPDGDRLIVGKPQGVLKLKLRKILEDYFDDPELKNIGTAFLCIRSVNGGAPVVLTNKLQFDALLQRFGSDDNIDMFMNEYQKLVNPEFAKMLEDAVKEGMEQGLIGNELQKFVAKKASVLSRQQLDKVRD